MPEVIINGSEGRIEGYYYHGKNSNAPIAIVLHPHPEHGGTMNNKVTYALYRSFVSRGFNTMRFNFRGVGKSEGKFSHGEGELSDAASVLDWMQTYNPNAKYCWVGGFSFGAWVGMQLLMRRPELDGFISISPPANMYDFSFLAPCPVSGLIVQGDRDTIVSKESVQELAKKLSLQKNIVVEDRIISDADHFFTNKLDLLVSAVDSYLDKSLGLQPQKAEEKA